MFRKLAKLIDGKKVAPQPQGEPVEEVPTGALRPLEDIPVVPVREKSEFCDQVGGLQADAAFKGIVEYFRDDPCDTAMDTTALALLYNVVRATGARRVLEIGTRAAGMTEIFARAMALNGSRTVTTVDPDETGRARAAIATWPKNLRDRVDLHECNAAKFFTTHEQAIRFDPDPGFDLALINGHRTFGNVSFELNEAARFVRRGGYIAVAAANQSQIYDAVMAFLKRHPEWTDVVVVTSKGVRHFSVNEGHVFGDLSFRMFLIRVPQVFGIAQRLQTFRWYVREAGEIEGLDLPLHRLSSGGILHMHVHAVNVDGATRRPSAEFISIQACNIREEHIGFDVTVPVTFEPKLDLPATGADDHRVLVVSMAWSMRARTAVSDSDEVMMMLKGEPKVRFRSTSGERHEP